MTRFAKRGLKVKKNENASFSVLNENEFKHRLNAFE